MIHKVGSIKSNAPNFKAETQISYARAMFGPGATKKLPIGLVQQSPYKQMVKKFQLVSMFNKGILPKSNAKALEDLSRECENEGLYLYNELINGAF